jgi:uncharacterized protein
MSEYQRRLSAVCTVALAVLAMFVGFARGQSVRTTPAVTARTALDYLLSEHFSELATMFNASMKEKLPLDILRDRLGSELASFGKPERVDEPAVSRDGEITLVSFPVHFSKTRINVEFGVEESGQLAAIHFRPANSSLSATWQHPSYSKPDMFHEREVTIGRDPWKLTGTLTVPNGKGPFPAVILIHGPGPNDRDESIRVNKPFADIAEGLGSRGIAVLRYDKRTKIYGRQMSESPFTLREETIDDALGAAAFLRLQSEINANRIFLLGHSLGGYAAPRIAKEDGKLAGAIFIAANARPIQELVLDQTQYLAAAGVLPSDEAKRRLDSLQIEVEKIKALEPGAANPPVVLGLPSEWLLDVKNYDPVAEAGRLSIPVLFLQGERDFQVGMKDFNRWKSALAGHPNITFHSYPDLNHLMMTGKEKSLPAEYLVLGNVSVTVIDDIAGWIDGLKK